MRRCPICKEKYTPIKPLQSCCLSPDCAVEKGRQNKAKKERAEAKVVRHQDKVRKEAIKTRSDYMKEAQIAFNSFIRARDAARLCICCNKPLAGSQVGGGFDCGHYRSVGSAPHLRFNDQNAHGQTKQCNRWGAGRAVDYRIGLIKRIGLAAVQALECDQTMPKWSIDELRAIKQIYKDKLNALKSQQTISHE
jgi:hypothetical protein